MSKPIEFSAFYKILRQATEGNSQKNKELQWILAEYEHAKDATNAYDEIGQIFCHHGVMELFDYTGLEDLKLIQSLENSVWKYLGLRMNINLFDYMVKSMLKHASEHSLSKKMASKWEVSDSDLSNNLEDLAKYVAEGIVEIVC